MSKSTVTPEDLNLYALDLLEGKEAANVEQVLRDSLEARREMTRIRGDLAALAMSVEQHEPPFMARQGLLQQIAREARTSPASRAPQTISSETEFATSMPQTSRPPFKGNSGDTFSGSSVIHTAQQSSIASSASSTSAAGSLSEEPPVQWRTATPIARQFSQERSVRHLSEEFENTSWPVSTTADDPFGDNLFSQANTALPPNREPDSLAGISAPGSELTFTFGSYNREKRTQQNEHTRLLPLIGWTAAAFFAVGSFFAVWQNMLLQQDLDTQKNAMAQVTANAARAQLAFEALQSHLAQRFVLSRIDTVPVSSGNVAYLPNRGTLVFQGSNLHPLPPDKTYELWLIPNGEGHSPIAAGTFKPDEHGYATVVLPQLPRGTLAGNFGVTLEDDGGSSSPTLPILLIGQKM